MSFLHARLILPSHVWQAIVARATESWINCSELRTFTLNFFPWWILESQLVVNAQPVQSNFGQPLANVPAGVRRLERRAVLL